jgi:hypothetical protein
MAGNGLLDFLNTPEGQGLLAAGFGGLAGARRGQPINSMGRAGLAGLQGYTSAQDQQQKLVQDAQRTKLFDMQVQQHQASLAQAQKAQEQAGMRQNYIGGMGQVTSPKIGAAPNQFDPMRWLGMGGSVEDAKALAGAGNWGKSAIKDYKEVRTPDGVQIVGFDEFGNQRQTGATPYKAPEVRDFGGYVGGIDPITGQVSKYGNKSMSPDAVASNQVAWANVGTARDRLNFDKQGKAEFKDGQWVMPPKDMKPGEARVVGGAGSAKLSEDQGKATGWLIQAENAWKNMQTATDPKTGTPAAARPGFPDMVGSIPSFGLSEGVANMMRGADRQKFMQGSSSLSESLLRAATGAGVNKDEAEQKVRELTPVFGEHPETTAQKMAAIPLYIESLKVRAGPGAAKAAGVLGSKPSDGWSITPAGK